MAGAERTAVILIKCDQGSPEWRRARSGVITASDFALCRKRYEKTSKYGKAGDFQSTALDHAFRLAIERISGEPLADVEFENYGMRRGHELEPEARRSHEIEKGVIVERVGIVLSDDRRFGASVDGLIEDDGQSEYKCFLDPAKIRAMLLEQDVEDNMPQVQGQLWITARKWCHFCLYCPALALADKALTVWEVARDDDYIDELELDLVKFMRVVDQYEAQLRAPRVQPADWPFPPKVAAC